MELVIDEGTARGWNQNGSGQWQYINVDGNAATGWLTVESAKYYFYADGSLAQNAKIDEYEVDENGVRKDRK